MTGILSKALSQKIHQAISEGLFPGCAIGVIKKLPILSRHDENSPARLRSGKPSQFHRLIVAAGHFRTPDFQHPYLTGKPNPQIKPDSIFDCASLTKVIPTSFLALELVEKEKIALADKLIKYLPEIKHCPQKTADKKQKKSKNKIKIKHLLSQTLNFDLRLSDLKNQTPSEILKNILNAPLKDRAGTSVNYCNLTSILLGLVIEKAGKKSLYTMAQKELFNPLQMSSSSFVRPTEKIPPDLQSQECAVPSEIDSWRKRELQGEIHDESAWMLSKIINPGSAGLFSNVPDLLNFLEMLLNEGSFRGLKLLKPETIRAGLGFELNQPWMGANKSEKTIGKTGFTGCSLLADMNHSIGIVILSNHTWPHRRLTADGQADKSPINQFRAAIADLILPAHEFPNYF